MSRIAPSRLGGAIAERIEALTRVRERLRALDTYTESSTPTEDRRAAAETVLRNEALRDVLNSLSYRERRVLELRYGLGGEHPRTLDEVGRTFNVTRERIRQIENQSLKKLRPLADMAKLRDVAA